MSSGDPAMIVAAKTNNLHNIYSRLSLWYDDEYHTPCRCSGYLCGLIVISDILNVQSSPGYRSPSPERPARRGSRRVRWQSSLAYLALGGHHAVRAFRFRDALAHQPLEPLPGRVPLVRMEKVARLLPGYLCEGVRIEERYGRLVGVQGLPVTVEKENRDRRSVDEVVVPVLRALDRGFGPCARTTILTRSAIREDCQFTQILMSDDPVKIARLDTCPLNLVKV